MNMLYEGLKTNATIVLVPSSALETMQLGALSGLQQMKKALGITDEKEEEKENNKEDEGEPVH